MGIRYWAVVALTSTLGLVGCGGEQSDQGNQTYTGSIAAISANSKITINDNGQPLTFNIGSAQIETDGDGELAPGKMVSIEGSHDGNNGHADKIKYDSEVEGFVTSNTIALDNTGSMIVMGQEVVVDDMTMYGDGISHASDIMAFDPAMADNKLIEVSGIFQDNGTILAKHVEYKTHGDIEIKGIVENLVVNGDVATFDIGFCSITVNADTEFNGMNSMADLVAGIEVEVHSSADQGSTMVDLSNGCHVTASKLELEDAHEDDMQFEFERGEVVSDLVDGSFSLKVTHDDGMMTDITIIVNENTAYGEGTVDDIVIGAILHVHGNYDVDGNLVANEIEFKSVMEMPHAPMASYAGYVDAVDPMGGTITVLGQMLMVTEMTMIDGHTATAPVMEKPATETTVMAAAADMPVSMTLADIAMGDYVMVKFERDVNGMAVAVKLIVEQGVVGESSRVEGLVSGVDATADTVFIEGVTVPGVAMLLPELVLDETLIGTEAMAVGTFAESVLTAKELHLSVHVAAEPVKTEPVVVK